MSLVDILSGDDFFDAKHGIKFVEGHTEIPVISLTVYLVIVFLGPKYMANREPMALRPLFKVWNFLLATFSILGAYYTVPAALKYWSTMGLENTVCTHPLDDYYYVHSGAFWYFLFGLSKIPELGDTFFLVAQKKPVIFLHWYHHVSVCIYCWHSYQAGVGAGIYYASMNFLVHSIMYSYYFWMCFPAVRKYIRKIAIFITSLQLLQMCGGVAATVATGWYWKNAQVSGARCHVNLLNMEMGFAIYTSYFILFGALFRKLYGPKPKGGADAKSKSA